MSKYVIPAEETQQLLCYRPTAPTYHIKMKLLNDYPGASMSMAASEELRSLLKETLTEAENHPRARNRNLSWTWLNNIRFRVVPG